MNTTASADLNLESEAELLAYMDRCSEEIRLIFARMDARAEQSAKIHSEIEANLASIEERMRHVQAAR
ncbi:MAG: hypothetical protein JO295_07040 [Verrucomicrobia bacterium]|nr:hypothetical protein [Verrucomicrobiota bacterium]